MKEVLPGDLIRLGNVEIEVFDPREPLSQSARTDKISNTRWKLVADSSWLSWQEYPLPGERVSVGRANDCDITIPGTHLSRQHAELHVQGNVLHVHDLASANGTFINEKRITDGIARPGDRLRLDVYSFRVIGPPSENDRTQVRRARPQKHSSAEKIAQNVDSKSWKTKPTSPGNRIKPDYSAGSKLITMISISLLIGMAAVLSYMFIS